MYGLGGGYSGKSPKYLEGAGLVKILEILDFDPPFLQKDMTQGGLAEKKVPRQVWIIPPRATVAFFSRCPPFSGHNTQLD